MSLINKKGAALCTAVISLGMLAGCATARNVSMQPGKGGVVAVQPANDPEARTKAEDIMRSTCQGKRWEIVEEGEQVVGSRTNGSGNASLSKNNLFSSN